MGLHSHSARRVAWGAVLAVVVGLVGVGVGVGTAEEPAAARPAPAQSVAAAEPARPLAPTTNQAPTPAPTAARTASPEPTPTREPAPETEPSQPVRASVPVRAAGPPALVPGTPCTVTARACADLGARTAWLIEDGVVRRGPVSVMIGDEIDPTPTGTFAVEWKAEAWTSREYLTQMPYSVFFAEGGIAFHEGSQDTSSAGCIKLTRQDAMAWFEYLQVGDEVQVR